VDCTGCLCIFRGFKTLSVGGWHQAVIGAFLLKKNGTKYATRFLYDRVVMAYVQPARVKAITPSPIERF
jgi:hypothetical protein